MAQARFRGDRLAEARRQNGMSQSQLAEAIGTAGRERISQWERGVEQPQPKLLRAVADVLGVDPLLLMDVDTGARTLRDLRLAAGMSLRDARTAAGLPYTTYYRLENGVGTVPPSRKLLSQVARALGVPVTVVGPAIERSRAARAGGAPE
ncbi:helix-turn-helix domain-containing protein [Jatrophihabitans cynanchi]|uniref:Helix-turn-helix domain-containing protein n=1 Tax=Jatrophihabitans cynanchi TaxID=2944128 RepID=A0ABY7JWX9_9ACTN|nr:helix-turn-helix transcriptional regulator [Jatrophihabitans sp. SB3-54]WAX55817.1 helix-turn-helix domain-containing protein [Jatrophihabitans sp. SB3-54]